MLSRVRSRSRGGFDSPSLGFKSTYTPAYTRSLACHAAYLASPIVAALRSRLVLTLPARREHPAPDADPTTGPPPYRRPINYQDR